ncbi:hypothetical protein PR048_017077 [Dryococelus australis]|uniref:Uncharacterized protein n=1 Tax=Dryococelus australis TaxID=614101 RepID=A0ABQ9H8H6_9NEOP|nr:hypothetical protein PR048_017077 [Dryococelus australis]
MKPEGEWGCKHPPPSLAPKRIFYCNCLTTRPHLDEPGSTPGAPPPGFSHVGIVPDDACGLLVFSGISRFPRPFIPVLLYTLLTSLLLALKTSTHVSAPLMTVWYKEIDAARNDEKSEPNSGRTEFGTSPYFPKLRVLVTSSRDACLCEYPSLSHYFLMAGWDLEAFKIVYTGEKVSDRCLSAPTRNVKQRVRDGNRPTAGAAFRQPITNRTLPARPSALRRVPGEGHGAPPAPRRQAHMAPRASGGAVRLHASHPRRTGFNPRLVYSGFSQVESYGTMPLIGGFSRGSSIPPTLHTPPTSSSSALNTSMEKHAKPATLVSEGDVFPAPRRSSLNRDRLGYNWRLHAMPLRHMNRSREKWLAKSLYTAQGVLQRADSPEHLERGGPIGAGQSHRPMRGQLDMSPNY